MANEQIKEGAHVLDVCVDYVGRDGTLDMDEIARRFATQSSVPLVIDSTEPPGAGGGAAAHRRAGDPQLGEPRGRRAARQPHGPGVLARPRVRRGGDLPADRRARPGPRRRVEDGGRPPHHRDRHRALRPAAERPDLRRPDVPALDRRRRPAPRRHRHDRGDPADQGRDPRRLHGARPVQRQLRAVARRPATPSTACSSTSASRPGSTRRSSTPPRSCRSTASPPSSATSASTSSGTAGRPDYDPLPAAARRVRRRQVDEDREARPQRPARRRAAQAAHHRRRPRRPHRPTSTRRWPAGCRRSTSSTTCCSTG